jgi:hypothetical protein
MNKKLIFSIQPSILLIFFIAITLSGCFSPWQGNNARFVISFAGAERSAFSRESGESEEAVNVRDLEHRIELTRGTEKITFSGKGAAVEGYAPAGNWAISVYSYFGGELYAAGSGEISLQDGQENVITITMRRAYKVTFNSNGGIGEVPPVTVMNGDSVELPGGDGLYNEGFDFIGWNTDEYGTGTHYSEGESSYITVTGNITFYAVWVPLVTDDVSITNPEISIAAPVKGAVPDTRAISEADSFTVETVSWDPADSPFKGGEVYTATVMLVAANGFTFIGLETATINGQTAEVSGNTGTAVTLSYTFAATIDKTVSSIAIKEQPTWTYTHLDTLNLTGLVVTLTYDDGTAPDDVPFASFVGKNITTNPVNGYQLTYPENNGIRVTVKYGDLNVTTDELTVNEKVIDIQDIKGVTAPATGGTPAAAITATEQYTGTVTWKDAGNVALSGNFMHDTAYTATITLTAKQGYTLQGLGTTFFTVGVATTSYADGVVTAVFQKTALGTFTSAPTLTVRAGTDRIIYTWTASNPVAENYDVYYIAGSQTQANVKANGIKIPNAASGGEITGLESGTAYSVIVTANKASYTSGNSAVRTAKPSPYDYIITGSGTSFTASRYAITIGTTGNIANVLTAIRTDANGQACSIQFGSGGDNTLTIGTASASFNNSGGTWGAITLTGKITGSVNSTTSGTIATADAVLITSTADIANTASSNGYAVYHNSTVMFTVSGGTVSTTSGRAIHNESSGAVTIIGGTVSAMGIGGRAIHNNSTGAVTITGGTVQNTGSSSGVVVSNQSTSEVNISGGTVSGTVSNQSTGAINISGGTVSGTVSNQSTGAVNISGGTVSGTVRNESTGKITVSQAAGATTLITSAATSASLGAIMIADSGTETDVRLEITGGTVENTATGNAVYNASTGAVNISSGTVSGGVRNESTGAINISGGTVQSTKGRVIYNASTGPVNISGGTVSATESIAILNASTGKITVSQANAATPTLITSANTQTPWQSKGTIQIANSVTTTTDVLLEITGGTVENTGGKGIAVSIDGYGTINISGGTVSATAGYAVLNNYSTVNISGGTFSATTGIAVDNNSGMINISSGMVSVTEGTAVQNRYDGVINITGGTISATTGKAIGSANPGVTVTTPPTVIDKSKCSTTVTWITGP